MRRAQACAQQQQPQAKHQRRETAVGTEEEATTTPLAPALVATASGATTAPPSTSATTTATAEPTTPRHDDYASLAISRLVGVDVKCFFDTQVERSRRQFRATKAQAAELANPRLQRRVLVDWTCNQAKDFRMQTITAHAAVAFLDRILCRNRVVERSQCLVLAMACLLVSAKFFEPRDRVPLLEDLDEVGRSYSFSGLDVSEMERVILTGLSWKVDVVTPVQLALTMNAVVALDDNDRLPPYFRDFEPERRQRKVNDYCEFFGDLALQEAEFVCFEPLELAAAFVSCTRRVLGITPVWSSRLERFAGIPIARFADAHMRLFNHFAESYPGQANAAHVAPAPVQVSPDTVADAVW